MVVIALVVDSYYMLIAFETDSYFRERILSATFFWALEEKSVIGIKSEILPHSGKSTQLLAEMISMIRAPSENASMHFETRASL